jgi:hypothetical protein
VARFTDGTTRFDGPLDRGERRMVVSPVRGGARASPFFRKRGAVAQLGERLNGIQEVDSSILFSSTISFHVRVLAGQVPAFLFLPGAGSAYAPAPRSP